jgi:hypothetical protein
MSGIRALLARAPRLARVQKEVTPPLFKLSFSSSPQQSKLCRPAYIHHRRNGAPSSPPHHSSEPQPLKHCSTGSPCPTGAHPVNLVPLGPPAHRCRPQHRGRQSAVTSSEVRCVEPHGRAGLDHFWCGLGPLSHFWPAQDGRPPRSLDQGRGPEIGPLC